MIYLAEFLGFLAVAVLVAASPLLARTIEHVRALLTPSSQEAAQRSLRTRSEERSEIRDEIRRMTAVLEVDRRGLRRDPRA